MLSYTCKDDLTGLGGTSQPDGIKDQKGISGTAKEHLSFPNINPAEEAGLFFALNGYQGNNKWAEKEAETHRTTKKLSLFFKYFLL